MQLQTWDFRFLRLKTSVPWFFSFQKFSNSNYQDSTVTFPSTNLTNEPVILQKLRPGKTQFQEGGHQNCRIAQRAEMAVTLCLTVIAFAVLVKYASSSGTRRRQTTRPLSRDLKLDPWLATVMELWPLHRSPPLALPISTMGLQQCDSVTLCRTCSPQLPHGAALWHRVSLALLCHTLPTRCHTHVHPSMSPYCDTTPSGGKFEDVACAWSLLMDSWCCNVVFQI